MSAISITLLKDEITPSLAHLSDPALIGRATLAAGTVIGAIAQRAFDEPGLRPTAWPGRKSGGSNPLLIKSGTLRQSIHVTQQGADTVRIGTPVIYGAVHQLGSAKASGRGSGIPARPFFPVVEDQLTGNASQLVSDAVRKVIGGG